MHSSCDHPLDPPRLHATTYCCPHIAQVRLLENSSYLGELQWRAPFVFDEAAQRFLASACDSLHAQPWVRRDPERDILMGTGRVLCVMEDFRHWLLNASGAETHPFVQPTFPAPNETAVLALQAFVESSAGARWRETKRGLAAKPAK